MAYQPLHHKYRPQTFAQLVGQDAIATTLTQAIKTGKIAPAYLFAGPRGTGKTSSARIFAKSLNCLASEGPTPEPCGTCDSCQSIAAGSALDTIEIDAASNTGVDNIRELIERAQFAPVRARYKLYLIDEAHMLSAAAFNALLKTLEEPPARVVFVLATTDPQRVLPTIVSRCQRFDFRRIPLNDLSAHLEQIARLENIAIAPEALAGIAKLANGGLRDAESLLDQLSLLTGEIGLDRVWDLVGAIPEEASIALARAIRTGDVAAILTQSRALLDRGGEPTALLQGLAGIFRDLLVARVAPERADLVALAPPIWEQLAREAAAWEPDDIVAAQKTLRESEARLKNSAQPRLWLEITLLTLVGSAPEEPVVVSPLAAPLPATTPPAAVAPPPPVAALPNSQPNDGPPELSTAAEPVLPAPPAEETPNLEPLWRQVLEKLQPLATKALVAQHCRLLALTGASATVGVRNPNLLRLATSKKANLEAAFSEICQQPTVVQLQVAAAEFDAQDLATPKSPPAQPSDPSPVVAVSAAERRQPTAPPAPQHPPAEPQTEPPATPAADRPSFATDLSQLPTALQEAARALAGDFDGEPIDLGSRSQLADPPPPGDAPDDPDGFMDLSRDPGEDFGSSDGEVPFRRLPPRAGLWDSWEVAANRPGPISAKYLSF